MKRSRLFKEGEVTQAFLGRKLVSIHHHISEQKVERKEVNLDQIEYKIQKDMVELMETKLMYLEYVATVKKKYKGLQKPVQFEVFKVFKNSLYKHIKKK